MRDCGFFTMINNLPSADFRLWTLDSDHCRLAVRIETLDFREFLQRGEGFFQCAAVVFDEAGAALELIHGEAREGSTRAARRQSVAWPGHVIAQHRRGPWA